MNRTESELPNVDKLNEAQAAWMALDSSGPEKEINRVIKLYEDTVPKAYLSVAPDLKTAAPIISGMPVWAHRQDMANAVKWANDYNAGQFNHRKVRLDVGWCGLTGKWVNL